MHGPLSSTTSSPTVAANLDARRKWIWDGEHHVAGTLREAMLVRGFTPHSLAVSARVSRAPCSTPSRADPPTHRPAGAATLAGVEPKFELGRGYVRNRASAATAASRRCSSGGPSRRTPSRPAGGGASGYRRRRAGVPMCGGAGADCSARRRSCPSLHELLDAPGGRGVGRRPTERRHGDGSPAAP